jgi:hypothetical protein
VRTHCAQYIDAPVESPARMAAASSGAYCWQMSARRFISGKSLRAIAVSSGGSTGTRNWYRPPATWPNLLKLAR